MLGYIHSQAYPIVHPVYYLPQYRFYSFVHPITIQPTWTETEGTAVHLNAVIGHRLPLGMRSSWLRTAGATTRYLSFITFLALLLWMWI